MTVTIPDFLVDRLRRRRCVLCVGLGLGRLAGLEVPTWRTLAAKMIDRLAEAETPDDSVSVDDLREAAERGDYFAVVGQFSRQVGRGATVTLLRELYSASGELPPLYQDLARLPVRGVITTGYDNLLGRPFGVDDDDGPPIFTHVDGSTLKSHRGMYLLAAHGELTRPTTLVVSRADLRQVVADTDYSEFCRELFSRHSLVFVGFSHLDPDLRALLERHFGGAQRALMPHVLLADDVPALEAQELRAAHGVEVVPVGGNLSAFAAALVEQVGAAAAADRPDDEDAEGWLRLLAEDPEDATTRAALDALERTYRDDEQWDPLIELLLGRLEHDVTSRGRRRLLREVAHVFHHELRDLDRAFTAYEAVLADDPEAQEVLEDLELLADATGRWNDLISDYAALIRDMSGPTAAPAWVRLGRWYEERLDHPTFALASYESALSADPRNREAHRARLRVLSHTEKWDEYVSAVRGRLAVEESPPRQLELWLSLADVYESRLDQPLEAVGAYLKALEIEPDALDTLIALGRLYRQLRDWRGLAEVLERQVALAPSPESAAEARHDLGVIRAEHLADRRGAVEVLEEVVAEHPKRVPTLTLLEQLYEQEGKHDESGRVLERLIELAATPEARLPLARRLAERLEERGESERLIEALEAIIEVVPDDQEAHDSLARVLRRVERFPELAQALRRQLAATEDAEMQREIHEALGALYERELQDLPRAIESYEKLLELGGDADEVLAALVRTYERQGNYSKVAQAALRRAESQRDPVARAELVALAGVMAAEHLGDDETAEKRFAEALELHDRHLPSRLGLIDLYQRRGDYLRAARLLTETVERTTNRLQRVRLLFLAGTLYADHVDDQKQAEALFTKVLEDDPEHADAGLRLADRYYEQERWQDLEPILDMLVRRVDSRDVPKKLRILTRLAITCERLGRDEKAERVHRSAHALDPTNREVLWGLAGLLYRHVMAARPGGGAEPHPGEDVPTTAPVANGLRDEAREAATHLRSLLVHHGDALDPQEKLAAHERLAVLYLTVDDQDRALEHCERALAIDPSHRAVLEVSVEVLSKRREWSTLVERLRQLIAVSPEPERSLLEEKLGDLYLDEMEDPIAAAEAYEAALDVTRRRRVLLTKLLNLYSEQKAWQRAIDTIEQLCDLESDAGKLTRHHYAAGVVFFEQMEDFDQALVYFEKALDDAPDNVEAWTLLEKIYTERKDWLALSRAYSRQLKRLPSDGMVDLRITFWSKLGDLLSTRLNKPKDALAAFEVTASLAPDDAEHQERLAALYLEAGPEAREKAAAAYQRLLQQDPQRTDDAHALVRLYRELEQWDRAYCIAAALVARKAATDEERTLYRTHRPDHPLPPRGHLAENVWKRVVMHPDEDLFIAAIFSRLGAPVALLHARPPEAFNLRRRDRVDVKNDDRRVVKHFKSTCELLDVPLPELYLREAAALSVQVANTGDKTTVRPAVVIGGPRTAEPDPREMLFHLGVRLAFIRPERYLRYVLPTAAAVETALRGMLLALKLELPAKGLAQADAEEAERSAAAITRAVPAQVLDPLTGYARKWLSGRTSIDLSPWLAATDLSASRAGLIASQDIVTAAEIVAHETGALTHLRTGQRRRRLLAYAISEDYFAVRQHLGLGVTSPD